MERHKPRNVATQLLLTGAFLLLCTLLSSQNTPPQSISPAEKSRIAEKRAQLPLSFEKNLGQTDSRVKFLSRTSLYTVFLTPSEVVFAMPMPPAMPPFPANLGNGSIQAAGRSGKGGLKENVDKPHLASIIRMQMVGANSNPEITGEDIAPGKRDYFIGRDPAKWQRKVPLYSNVRYREIYSGVDLSFRGGQQQMEFDFVVKPGADAKKIVLNFNGAREIKTDAGGDLILASAAGKFGLRHPVAYQEGDDGKRHFVDVRFSKKRHKVGFKIKAYDHRKELIIDPELEASTYLGGTSQDEGLGITVDSSQNVYLVGATLSIDFPTNPISFSSGGYDVFVTIMDKALATLIYSTYFGGSNDDFGTGVNLNTAQSLIYITGYTDSPDLPVQGQNSGGQDAFVASFDGNLQSLGGLFGGTYLGGSDDDFGTAVTSDSQANIWIVGQTFSSDFPVQFPLSNESEINLGHGTGPSDAFVAELDPSFGVIFATYWGGSQQDIATSITIDTPNNSLYNVYLAGGTNSPDLLTFSDAYQPTCGGDGNCDGGQDDAFISAITNNTQPYSLVYSTFLGGSGKDDANSIALDQNLNVYVTGQTNSPGKGSKNFPTTAGALASTLKGIQNAFVTELDPTLTDKVPQYSTYLGGSGSDAGLAITTDSINNVYLMGRTNSPDFPTINPTQSTIGGGQDAFVSAFEPNNNSLTLTFSTFLGGPGDEALAGGGIAVDAAEDVYVTSDTNSSTGIAQGNVFQAQFNGSGNCTVNNQTVPCEDAFVTWIHALDEPVLTLQLTGTGLATVTVIPKNFQCGPTVPETCTHPFPFDTQLTLTVSTNGSTFNGWSGGGCQGTGDCVLTLTSNTTVTADFTDNQQSDELTVGVTGNGSVLVSPPGTDCPANTSCNFLFSQNTQVTLTANPIGGWTFGGWSGGCANFTGPTCMVTMTQAGIQVGATFNPPPLTLSVALNGTGSGTVTSNTGGIDCPPTCSGNFSLGQQVALTASPGPGSVFAGWGGGGCSGTTLTCTVVMNNNVAVTATFNVNPIPRLSVNLDGTGSGTVTSSPAGISCPGTCSATFSPGTVVTLTATTISGVFLGWEGNGINCIGTGPCSITLTTGQQVSVNAIFTLSNSALVLNLGGSGTGQVTSQPPGISCPNQCAFVFQPGDPVTLTASPTNGASFAGWGGACSGIATTCNLVVTSNLTVTANFTAPPPTLTVTLGGAGTGNVTSQNQPGISCPSACTATYSLGATVALVAAPTNGSTFRDWAGDALSFGCFTKPTCVITMNKSTVNVTANFDPSNAPPPPFDFTANPPGNSAIPPGGSTAYGLSLLSLNNFTDTINLSCSVQPASSGAPTCSLNPSTVTLAANQAASSTLTINAFTTTGSLRLPSSRHDGTSPNTWISLLGFGVLASCLGFRWRPKSRAFLRVLGGFLILCAVAGHIACGGGAGSGSPSAVQQTNAQPGNYAVTVTATGTTTGQSQVVTVSVTVQ